MSRIPKIVNTPYILTGDFIVSSRSSTRSTSATSTSTSLTVKQYRSSQPDKAKGVIGTRGPSSPICPQALSLEQINSLTNSSGATTELRKRAVKIAYSYVGADEVPGNNIGWYDSLFQENVANLGQRWTEGAAWCNIFTNLVWQEAYTTGNALVPASNNSVYENTFKNTFRSMKYGTYNDKQIKVSRGVFKTLQGFKDKFGGKYAITKSQAKKGKKLPQPGDMIIYNGGHIELVTKVYTSKGKMTHYDIVSGNSGAKDPRDGGGLIFRKKISIDTTRVGGIMGFAVLSETYS